MIGLNRSMTVISPCQTTKEMKPRRFSGLPALVLAVVFSFMSGYVLGNWQQPLHVDQVEEVKDLFPSGSNKSSVSGAEATKDIIIVFTVDEQRKIHVLNVSGGYNILTDYIKKSLEGRIVDSAKALPGINYVMTLKFPSSV